MSALLAPPILFFVLGMLATWLRAGLRIPHPIPKLLSLYLLFSIGYRGGLELRHSPLGWPALAALAAAILLASVMPIAVFFLARRRLGVHDAGGIAATYGSISAVTFITACSVLEDRGIPYSGHMVAAMALMESPAIIIAVMLIRMGSRPAGGPASHSWRKLLHESFLNGPVFLLLGSMAVGVLSDPGAEARLRPFAVDFFTGALCFFLLDLGLIAARRLGDLARAGPFCTGLALVIPVAGAGLGMATAAALRMPLGDAFLLTMLAGSASYIAVPAALRVAAPEANPGLYVPMALGVTFPFNIAAGLPLYLSLLERWWG